MPLASAPVLQFDRISKTFGKRAALQSVTFSLNRGEFRLLVGPNGGGKSTLLRIAVGLLEPDSGDVRLFGAVPNGARRMAIGFLPGTPGMPYDWLSVDAALTHHGRYYYGWDQSEAKRLMERLELDGDVSLGALSSGQRRRFQLVSALAHHPQVLLLDEPLAHLDPAAMRMVPELISRYRDLHPTTTILLATHAPDAFSHLADGIISLAGGIVTEIRAPAVVRGH